ncbi:MAG: D-tyrosyl-tRNA(Tyr) deacylase [Candidatus Kapabacteria bacterium]|nr:D-tyrosyl-tRNA(Tyr) deacylase [Ignavibacteriota bacterium]MCW5886277.1 D-tyrosyl-tRNA(Tyr) deacylase [Candidatus Kapabacteria bacterium]
MKIVVQRVSEASVTIEGKINGRIEKGLLVLVGFTDDDNEEKVRWICKKLLGLRIFSDDNDKMNLSVLDVAGGILVISNFTLYGDSNKGNRPNFTAAARPETAIPLYDFMIQELRKSEIQVETGVFGAMMDIHLTNDGPVTLVLER